MKMPTAKIDHRVSALARGEESDGCALCEFDGSGPPDAARSTGDDRNSASVDDGMYIAVDGQEGFETPVGRGRTTNGWTKRRWTTVQRHGNTWRDEICQKVEKTGLTTTRRD